MQDLLTDQSENHRIFTLPNGNKVHFKRQDPYGFWSVNYDKGPMPEHLAGAVFTSFYKAEEAVKAHLENNKKLEKPVENAPNRNGRDREQLSTRPNN